LSSLQGCLADCCCQQLDSEEGRAIDRAIVDLMQSAPHTLWLPSEHSCAAIDADSFGALEDLEADQALDLGADLAADGQGGSEWEPARSEGQDEGLKSLRQRFDFEALLRAFLDFEDLPLWRQRLIANMASREGGLRALVSRHLISEFPEFFDVPAAPGLDWLAGLPLLGELESAARAYLIQQFFARIKQLTTKEGLILEFLEAYGHLVFSRRVAATIRLPFRYLAEIQEQMHPVWGDIALWLFVSLGLGRTVSSGYSARSGCLADVASDAVAEEGCTEPEAGIPLLWDLLRFSLAELFKGRALGQSSGTHRFLPGAFANSAVGKALRATKVACWIPLQVRHLGPCPSRKEPSSFLGELPCTCPVCSGSPAVFRRESWLISEDQLQAGAFVPQRLLVCGRQDCRRIASGGSICAACKAPLNYMPVFVPSKGVALDAKVAHAANNNACVSTLIQDEKADSRVLVDEGELHELTAMFYKREAEACLNTIRKSSINTKRTAAARRFIVMASLTTAPWSEIVANPIDLPPQRRASFFNNLAKQYSVARVLDDLNGSVLDVLSKLDLIVSSLPIPLLDEANMKVVKHRLKEGFVTFLRSRNNDRIRPL
jgi:hypothetical protein